MQKQQSCSKTIDVHFNHNDIFTVQVITKQFQQLASKVNMLTEINTCNNKRF